MLKFLVTTLLLLTLFLSYGEMEKCSLSECKVSSIELCLDCVQCGLQSVAVFSVNLKPLEISEDKHSHESSSVLIEINRPEEIFRPPISRT